MSEAYQQGKLLQHVGLVVPANGLTDASPVLLTELYPELAYASSRRRFRVSGLHGELRRVSESK